jgi:hypothetical protein
MLIINQFLFIVGMVIQFLAVLPSFKIPFPFKSKAYKYDKKSNYYTIIKKAKIPKLYGEKGMPFSDKIIETLKARLNVILSFVGLIILIYVGYSQFS